MHLPGTTLLLVGSYDYRLVAMSVVIAILASYAALDLAGRVTAAHGAARGVWLAGGATAMGLGIWQAERSIRCSAWTTIPSPMAVAPPASHTPRAAPCAAVTRPARSRAA